MKREDMEKRREEQERQRAEEMESRREEEERRGAEEAIRERRFELMQHQMLHQQKKAEGEELRKRACETLGETRKRYFSEDFSNLTSSMCTP